MSIPLSRVILALASAAFVNPTSTATDDPAPRPSFSEPSFSPDRREIAFASGGDIWTVPATGGEARLLVSNPATERKPIYSPDGSKLAFVSTRTGNGDIYVLSLVSGDLQRITFDGLANAAITDGNFVTAPAWPAHPEWLPQFLLLLGTRIEL